MTIEHDKPFYKTRLDEETLRDPSLVQSIRFNRKEMEAVKLAGRILEEEKLSSTVKQLMKLGLCTLHDSLEGKVIQQVFKNKKDNRRLGILIEDI